ncbi:JEMB protein [Saccharospirillum sp. MSK14-1]|uniref:antibiotic biosynthesis monooxygenase family protein n=1 Tax=Saccharospirillum sp. MSK14-1 TaxID=1897632 RepID=UPI000D3AE0AD|nr:antibiotic biosynthesis monooxygenase [Saccharospirillum sp. MSK14-1]PTY38500.1 JEMB protein [Saccharospirillum sp. MSK14-1]
MFANTPKPPYYAVIFSSELSDDVSGYEVMAEQMITLAEQQPGFLGVESARSEIGITVSYWSSLESIRTWKQQTQHRQAQQLGRDQWYRDFRVRIARVEHDYSL